MILRDRPDGTLVRNLPRLRRIMPFVMPRRSDAPVYFEQVLDLTATQAYLKRWNEDRSRPRLTLFHILLTAAARTLHLRPRLNRFIAGKRVWQRNAVEISVPVIKARNDDALLTVVKQTYAPGLGLRASRAVIEEGTRNGRAQRRTASEAEVDLVTRLPRFMVSLLVALQRFADHWNLVPASLIRNDPLYASLMVTHLGSIGIDAAWHHLYEHGTLGLFMALGKARPMAMVTPEGTLAVRPGITLRYAFDDRVADGFYAARSLDLFKRLVEEPWRLETPDDAGPGAP